MRSVVLAAVLLVGALMGCGERETGERWGGGERPDGALRAVAQRLESHVRRLAVPGGRPASNPAVLSSVANDIAEFWTEQGYRVERQPIPGLGPSYVNILAFPDGATWADEPLILGAHYDTVVGTPGADDNASAVAVLLEASRPAKPRTSPRPVVFAAFTLEEPPYFQTEQQGSWVLASELRKKGHRLAGAVILEMVGYYRQEERTQTYPFPVNLLGYPKRGNFCGVVANRASRGLIPDLARDIREAGLPVQSLAVPGKGRILPVLRLSDHAPFWDLGYKAVMLTDTSFYRNPHYHGPGDRPETLDFVSMARLVRGLRTYLGF